MGVSMLKQDRDRYCFEKCSNDYCIITDSLVLMNDLNKPARLYNYIKDPGTKNDLTNIYPEISATLNTNLQAFLQVSGSAVKNNRIYFVAEPVVKQ
jgi:hypothetical protein